MDKLIYVLTRPDGGSSSDFSEMLRGDVGAGVVKELPAGTEVRLRIQNDLALAAAAAQVEVVHGGEGRLGSDGVSSSLFATVLHEGVERPVDALVVIRIAEEGAPLDAMHQILVAATSTCQGWRVQETRYADDLDDPEIGEPSPHPGGGAFIQRPDGMTRERFSLLWHLHGHHLVAKAKDRGFSMGRYIQDRVVEPVTPTFWRIDGFGDGGAPPEVTAREPTVNVPANDAAPDFDYQRDMAEGPGEVQFLRLPPKLLFGTEYILAR